MVGSETAGSGDHLLGGAGDDVLYGGFFNDDSGADILDGGAGNDLMIGGEYNELEFDITADDYHRRLAA